MTDKQLVAKIERLELELENRQLRRKLDRLRPVGAKKTRADRMREIPRGGSAVFEVRGDVEAASIRGSAYQALGRGRVRCVRISASAVRVYRLAIARRSA